MNKNLLMITQKTIFMAFSFCFLLASAASYGLPFNVAPKAGTQLPTTVIAGGITTAYYTVSNNTQAQRNSNYAKYLPPNVSQVTSGGTYADTCGATFNLAGAGQAGNSCTLQLTVSGAVNGSDPDPHNHLFVCFPGGTTCAGTNFPLNVTQTRASFAYVIVPSQSKVLYCPVNSNGSLGTCNDTTGSGWTTPVGIAINPAGTFAYVANSTTTVFSCPINGNGTFGTCKSVGSGFTNILALAINPAGTLIYVSNTTGTNPISVCTINGDGSLSSCQIAGSLVSPNSGMAISLGGYAFITDEANSVVNSCLILGDGTFGACGPAGGSGFSAPNAIALNPAGTYAYITNIFTRTISTCKVTNGTLSLCSTISGTAGPRGIAINKTNTFAYATNFDNAAIDFCTIDNSTGLLSSCAITQALDATPSGIAVS